MVGHGAVGSLLSCFSLGLQATAIRTSDCISKWGQNQWAKRLLVSQRPSCWLLNAQLNATRAARLGEACSQGCWPVQCREAVQGASLPHFCESTALMRVNDAQGSVLQVVNNRLNAVWDEDFSL